MKLHPLSPHILAVSHKNSLIDIVLSSFKCRSKIHNLHTPLTLVNLKEEKGMKTGGFQEARGFKQYSQAALLV